MAMAGRVTLIQRPSTSPPSTPRRSSRAMAGGGFVIQANSGLVTVANGSLLDREAAASHNITVRATSADGSTADTTFAINVNDGDEFEVTAAPDTNGALQ